MYRPTFELSSFDGLEQNERVLVLLTALEVLAVANSLWLRARPSTLPLYDAGIRYLAEVPAEDNWQDIPRTLALRTGDCEDLCAWRVAELRMRERERARFVVEMFTLPNGARVYHIRVRRADGTIEDPSRVLGMRGDELA